MKDESSEGSSDELCPSYKSAAKRIYGTALKRSAEVTWTTIPAAVLETSDSDNKDKSQPGKSPENKIIERPKRKQPRRNAKGRGKRKALDIDVFQERSNSPEVCIYNLSSSDSDAPKVLEEVRQLPMSTKGTSKRIIKNILENVVLDSDLDTESESAKSQDSITVSGSDVEPLSPLKTGAEKVDDNELMSIKISWKQQPIQKFNLRRHQKFKTLLEHFSKLEGVPLEQIVIYGGKDSCRLIEPYDTPDTIGITVTDILGGGVLTDGSAKQSCLTKRFRDPSQADGDEIEIRVQQEKTRSFPVLIKRHQKMQVVFIKVAEQLEMDLDKVKLYLDGETISSNLTPTDLDLEDGDVLDMI